MATASLDNNRDYPEAVDLVDDEGDEMIYARHAEIRTLEDLEKQRGTPIPALFNQFYKFIQNPSTVSVETFKRMVDTDDTIGSGIDFMVNCLTARIGRFEHPNKEITEWVNKALDEIQGGFASAVKEMLSATWAGFSVQEKVWKNDDDMGFIIKKLPCLPPGSVLFETERTGELTSDGILQYQRNYNPSNLAFGSGSLFGFSGGGGQGLRNDPYAKFGDFMFPIRTANTYSYLSIRIPVEKCVHYAFDAQGKFGNPYGRSMLRRAYKWWVMKDAFLQMLSVALDRKGTPLTIIYADPNTTIGDASKATPGLNVKGQNVGIRADAAAQKAFANIHNDSFIILPGKKGQIYETDFVPQASNAGDFLEAIKMCDRAMMRALLVPALIFTNGDGTGSNALGEQHAKTFDKICDGILSGATDVLETQIVYPLIAYNFPRSMWEKEGLGKFGKIELTPDEIKKEMEIITEGIAAGAIDMNSLEDLNTVRSKLRFPPVDKVFERPDPMGVDGDGEGDGGEGKEKDDAKEDKPKGAAGKDGEK